MPKWSTICQDLIRIDTTNFGTEPGPGERRAAERVAELLDEVDISVELFESAPKRTSLIAHWEPDGVDRTLRPCSSTATWMSCRPMPTTGPSTRSLGRSSTTASGVAAR